MGGRKDLVTAGLTLGALADWGAKAKGKMSAIIATESGSVVSFTAADAAPVVDLTAAIVPVQSGRGDPSPTNIRPISGWTECKVTRAGNNLLAKPFLVGVHRTSGYSPYNTNVVSTDGFHLKAGTYIVSDAETTIYKHLYINRMVDETKTDAGYQKFYDGNRVVTIPADGLYNFQYNGTNISSVLTELNASAQLELGSAATAYEPYRGNTYTVTFGSAGTVYGGTLDVTTGKLTATMANIASYNGETLPGTWISDRDVYAEGTTPTIGAQVVYELAEPLVYHLSPVEIRTLAGQNTIWADTGDVTVKYATTDTKAFIDKYIAARRNG